MTKTFFSGVTTLEELKKEYRQLCMLHHPDLGGNTETMQQINREYEHVFNLLKDQHNQAAAEEAEREPNPAKRHTRPINETPEEYQEIILKLLKIGGIEIELCGSWLWIFGDTYAHKAELKAAGCKWASKKYMWYWRPESEACTGNRKSRTMKYIRQRYGSEKIQNGRKADKKEIAA